MTRRLTDLDLAYTAALIDTLAVLKTRRYEGTDLPVAVVNTTRFTAAVDHLCAVTGLDPTTVPKDYAHRGCNEHCPDRHLHVVSEAARWQVTGVAATIVLHNVAPFMRAQQAVARDLVATGRTLGYKGHIVTRLARLGWAVPELKPQPRARISTGH